MKFILKAIYFWFKTGIWQHFVSQKMLLFPRDHVMFPKTGVAKFSHDRGHIFFTFRYTFGHVKVWKIKTLIYTSAVLKPTHTVKQHRQKTYVKAHTHTLSQSHTLPPRLWDGLFSHRHADYFGTLIYSAVIVVFSHFLFSSSTLIYSTYFYLPVNAGSNQTSCSHPLQSRQKRTSHCEGRPTTNKQINKWIAGLTGKYPQIMYLLFLSTA